MTGKFQTIILIVFIVAAVFGILVFSGAIPIGDGDAPGALGVVVLWGTIDSGAILPVLAEFNDANPAFILRYEEKSPETFDQDLLEALAESKGPDLFFLPDNLAYRYQSKILAVPYENFSVASFKKSFAEGGEVFLTSHGILALPIFIDPLVMYYNRSILDASAIASPPTYWDEVLQMVPVLTQKDGSNTLRRSAVALGQFSNIAHAKEILSTLFMQVGNPIVAEENGAFLSALNEGTYKYNLPSVLKFYTSFAEGGEVFLTSHGILALPIFIDPLVMYYNRSVLDASAIASPPAYWDEVLQMVPVLTKKDESNTLRRSAVALGQFSNIAHAKEILSALFMQVGNPIVAEENGAFLSALNEGTYKYNLPSVLKFYTSFADPLASVYSWNRSFASSSDAFSSENLAFYFGFASELKSLINKNPNQNFLPAPFPQLKNAKFKLTAARMTGLAISQFSKNLNGAATAASRLANGDFAGKLAMSLGVVPARRDLLSAPPADAYSSIFYSSALYSRSWLDPSPKDTDNIFRTLIERVLSNSMSPDSALADADAKLNLLLTKNR